MSDTPIERGSEEWSKLLSMHSALTANSLGRLDSSLSQAVADEARLIATIERAWEELDIIGKIVGRTIMDSAPLQAVVHGIVTERDALRAELASAKAGAVSVKEVILALKLYRCHHHQYDDGSGGMRLSDLFTPDGDTSITRGLEEIELLADHLAAELFPSPPADPPQQPAAKAGAVSVTERLPNEGDWDDDDDFDRSICQRCGGEGFIEYAEAGPDVWGEDCPSEENHLVDCPDCDGTGNA